jgi:hypothetical protein
MAQTVLAEFPDVAALLGGSQGEASYFRRMLKKMDRLQ